VFESLHKFAKSLKSMQKGAMYGKSVPKNDTVQRFFCFLVQNMAHFGVFLRFNEFWRFVCCRFLGA